jgi:hypothetical protein
MGFDWGNVLPVAPDGLPHQLREAAIEWLTAKAIISEKDNLDNKVTLYHYEDISDNVSADYSEVDIRGRSQPYVHYVKTNQNKIVFTSKLVAGLSQFGIFSTAADVNRAVLRLKSWLYPSYLGNTVSPPPMLYLQAGNLYQGLPGLVRSVDFTYERPWNMEHLPLIVTVNIDFEVLYSSPVDRQHVSRGMSDSTLSTKGKLGYYLGKAGDLKDKVMSIPSKVASLPTAAIDRAEKAKTDWNKLPYPLGKNTGVPRGIADP